jgi:diphthamide biosynthesis methyltransferase
LAYLYNENNITIKGLEAIGNADVIYAEFHTSPLGGKMIEEVDYFSATPELSAMAQCKL